MSEWLTEVNDNEKVENVSDEYNENVFNAKDDDNDDVETLDMSRLLELWNVVFVVVIIVVFVLNTNK